MSFILRSYKPNVKWKYDKVLTQTPTDTAYVINAAVSRLFNPLNTKLNPICHLLALLGAHPILHISRIRVKSVPSQLSRTNSPNLNHFRPP
jgi:hypothetical protein